MIDMTHGAAAEDYDCQPQTVSGSETSKRPPMTAFSGANDAAGFILLYLWPFWDNITVNDF
jgi:hypothetical protein